MQDKEKRLHKKLQRINKVLNKIKESEIKDSSVKWWTSKRKKHLKSLIDDLKELADDNVSNEVTNEAKKFEHFLEKVLQAWKGKKRYSKGARPQQAGLGELYKGFDGLINALEQVYHHPEKIGMQGYEKRRQELISLGFDNELFSRCPKTGRILIENIKKIRKISELIGSGNKVKDFGWA